MVPATPGRLLLSTAFATTSTPRANSWMLRFTAWCSTIPGARAVRRGAVGHQNDVGAGGEQLRC
eukprot:6523349-Alexandrium_andersonii.AAC.1